MRLGLRWRSCAGYRATTVINNVIMYDTLYEGVRHAAGQWGRQW